MIHVSHYTVSKEICRGNRRFYYAALRNRDSKRVMIKTHFSGKEASRDRLRLQHEYELLKKIKGPGLLNVQSMENYAGGLALVCDIIHGTLLSDYLNTYKNNVSSFLKIALSLAENLSDLHRRNIIHKEIQPENIFINPDTFQTWIVDFRFATSQPGEKPKSLNLSAMEGSLPYMSPEQTGRMNRGIDYRSDFYSLGVLFYKLLSGRLPFSSTDPLELVHRHLAGHPVSPDKIDRETPAMISGITLKLLSKNPEDRYVSGQGLVNDLKQCRKLYEDTGAIDRFDLAQKDYPEKLRISQKIYGRDKEINQLMGIYKAASDGNAQLVVISGHPGVGKTSLVQEIRKSVTRKSGYFISGKFDPFHRNVPYSALVLAFRELVKQLLAESEANLRHWRIQLLTALGLYGQIIIDVIPEIELVIGPQPPVKKADAVEARNRFNRVMIDFIQVFCTPKHTLVIFLDDLQWGDPATLKLIEGLMADIRLQHLFLITSYRDNEVDGGHPLWATLKKIKMKTLDFLDIHLNPLGLKDTVDLIADSLKTGKQPVTPLAELVVAKTGGNPFFVNQFLIMLYQKDKLAFNTQQNCWEWHLPGIRAMDITDNVVELLLRRLEMMPDDTRHLMMMAACIGSTFDLNSLKTITDYSESDITVHLLPAIGEDLVVTIPKDIIAVPDGDEVFPTVGDLFKFRHDRVRQAAYALIAAENKKAVHLKIGELLFKHLDPLHYEENIFDVIHHLNIAAELITDRQERYETAELNLVAGNKAKALAAFEPAFSHYKMGILFLSDGCWQQQYNLTLKLHVECAEAARLCGNFPETRRLFDIVLENARTVLDSTDIYQIRILALISEDRRFEALDMTRAFLNKIGITLPAEPSLDDIHHILSQTLADLSGTNVEALIDLPEMTDPARLAAIRVMGSIFGATYQLSREWFVILVCHQVKLSISHGNFSYSAIAYSGFGIILCGLIDDIETGHRFGRLGLELLKRFDARELEAEIYTIFYAGVNHWRFHLKDSIAPLLSAHHTGLETGDYEFASYCAFFACYHSFLCGFLLEEVEEQMTRSTDNARHHKQLHADIYFSVFHQTALNFLGSSDRPENLSGPVFDEETAPALVEANDTLALFYMHFCKTMLCYHFDASEEAIQHADQAEKLAERVPGNIVVAVSNFYDSLSRLAAFDTLSKESRRRTLARVESNQKKMQQWMTHAPENFSHKYLLVKAETARVLEQYNDAISFYDQAIHLARENGYKNEEALACELAAGFWLAQGRKEFAAIFMQQAYNAYSLWGAFRKIEHLHKKYHQILPSPQPVAGEKKGGDNANRRPGWHHEGLDVASLIKASQAISSEIVLDNLLKTMMKIVIENAGAEKGCLLLNSQNGLYVAAHGVSDANEIYVQSSGLNSDGTGNVSMSVVNYAVRTREWVVSENAVSEGRFGSDPYIIEHRPKSVLGLPVIYQSKLTGVIYLENRLSSNVFSPDRIEVLKLLTSQIAISIENTMLFEKQRAAEEKYRGIFENAVEGIFLSTVKGRFINANPSMAQILGYASAGELCEQVTDIEHQLYALPKQRDNVLRMLRKNETVADLEVSFRKKDGSTIWVSLSARSIYDENGKLILIEGFIVDISQRKAATDALRKREEDLRKENIRLRSDIKDRFRFGRIIGKSPAMQQVYETILKAANTDASVIVYGESGTGKELVAKEIHAMGDRKEKNFVPVNCGAIPENLLESEFFGYKKGAFTGADRDKKGVFDHARGGTLFLDELGEISLSFQVKLLRVLEDGSYTPLGSHINQTSDARVIAATSRNLQEAIRKGQMREDFFYRIHIIPIYLPPLRDRVEDIPLLIEHFSKNHTTNAPPISAALLESLMSHKWPGNVRELQNVLHRYYTLGTMDFLPSPQPHPATLESPTLSPEQNRRRTSDAAVMQPNGVEKNQPAGSIMENAEKNLILNALDLHQWHRKRAADHLGIPLRSFYRKLKKYQIIQKE